MGGKKQTVTQQSSPWKAAQPYLTGAMSQAQGLYNQGAFAPVPYGFGQYANTAPTAAPTAAPTGGTPSTGGSSPFSGSSLDGLFGGGGGSSGGTPRGGGAAASSGYNPFGGMSPVQMEEAARKAAEMRVTGFGDTTQGAMNSILNRASGGASGLDAEKS